MIMQLTWYTYSCIFSINYLTLPQAIANSKFRMVILMKKTPLNYEGKKSLERIDCTLASVNLNSHWYVFVPFYRQYPDETRSDYFSQFVNDNCCTVFISVENLQKED